MLIAVCSPETATAGKGAHFQLVALVVHVMPGLTTHDTHILSICAVSSGCFSIFASFTMSSIILILPTTRSIMSSRLVLYLCTSDMLWIASVVYVTPNFISNLMCLSDMVLLGLWLLVVH